VALETAVVHIGDPHAVTRDADEASEPFVASAQQGLDRTAGSEGDVPLVGLDEVVELDEIDVVGAEPAE
jgi:hypothetical protein